MNKKSMQVSISTLSVGDHVLLEFAGSSERFQPRVVEGFYPSKTRAIIDGVPYMPSYLYLATSKDELVMLTSRWKELEAQAEVIAIEQKNIDNKIESLSYTK